MIKRATCSRSLELLVLAKGQYVTLKVPDQRHAGKGCAAITAWAPISSYWHFWATNYDRELVIKTRPHGRSGCSQLGRR